MSQYEAHRTRRIPRPRRPPRSLYWIAVPAALAIVAGVTVGTLTFGGFLFAPHQSSASGSPPGPPAGVSFPLAQATIVTATSTPASGSCTVSNLGSLAVPTNLTNGTNTVLCLSTSAGGFTAGDSAYVVEVAWNSTATLSHEFEIQVFLGTTPSTNDVSVTSYVKTSATIASSEGAVFSLDVTQSGDTQVTGYNVLVTQL